MQPTPCTTQGRKRLHSDQQMRRPSKGVDELSHLNKGQGVSCWAACPLALPPPLDGSLQRAQYFRGSRVISAPAPWHTASSTGQSFFPAKTEPNPETSEWERKMKKGSCTWSATGRCDNFGKCKNTMSSCTCQNCGHFQHPRRELLSWICGVFSL